MLIPLISVNMRSQCIEVGPDPMTDVLIRRENWIQTQSGAQGEPHVMTKAETVVIQLQAREHQEYCSTSRS